ncbi:MAG: MlaD family protein [Gammaproteobacteria bacterium]
MRSRSILFRYANEAVGAFLLLAVVVFVSAALQTGRVRDWFEPRAALRVVLPQEGLSGLSEGASVEIIGTRAGEVSRIVIDPEQHIHAEVSLRKEMVSFVRRDSRAIIRKQFGVAGDAYLEITRGFGEELDWSFAVLEATADRAPTETMAQVVNEVRNKVLPLIDQVEQVVASLSAFSSRLSDPAGGMQRTLANVNTLTEDLSGVTRAIRSGEGAIGRLVNDATIVTQLETLLEQTNDSMSRMSPLLEKLQTTAASVARLGANLDRHSAGLPKVSSQAQVVLVALEKVLRDLRKTTPELPRITRGIADSTENLPVLIIQTQQAMAELDRLMRQMRASWILGGNDAQPQPAGSRLSPLEVKP